MDKRTLKIRHLECQVRQSKDFIREMIFCAIESANDNKVMSNVYWVKKGVATLEILNRNAG